MRRALIYGFSAACAVGGGLYCYGFGQRISGLGLGLVLAANGALFSALAGGILLEWLLPASSSKASDQEA